MKIKFSLLLLVAGMIISSCSDHIYAPAMHHSDIAYLPKPVSADVVKSANYISGALVVDESPNYSDELVSAQLNFSRGHVFDHFNLAYGAFGTLGNYHNSELQPQDPNYFKNKFFGAAGGRLSGNFFVSSRHIDFRFIGFEAAYSHEFGDYLDFRRAVTNKPGFYTDPRADLFTLGGTTEIIFHTNKVANQFGFRFFWGGTFGNDNVYRNKNSGYDYRVYNPGIVTAAYFMQIKNFIGIVEAGNYVQLRLGYRFR